MSKGQSASGFTASARIEAILLSVDKLLRSLPGIVQTARIEKAVLRKAEELEARVEDGGIMPVRNLGIRNITRRDAAFVLLKDKHFREPHAATVYLVEDIDHESEEDEHCISVEKKKYKIIGEEIMDPSRSYEEKTIALAKSFVLFPERRSSAQTPSYFILPPLEFPELERESSDLGITNIISISPSVTVDTYLRGIFGFSPYNKLATLMVGFNFLHSIT